MHCVHCFRIHKFYFLATFSLKMGLTVLFTHLKIILLQYFSVFSFSFQFSVVSKRNLRLNNCTRERKPYEGKTNTKRNRKTSPRIQSFQKQRLRSFQCYHQPLIICQETESLFQNYFRMLLNLSKLYLFLAFHNAHDLVAHLSNSNYGNQSTSIRNSAKNSTSLRHL